MTPSLTLTLGLVRASTKNSFSILPFAMNVFSLLRIDLFHCRSARNLRPALVLSAGGRRLSEPAVDLVIPRPSKYKSSVIKGFSVRPKTS